MFSTSHIDTAYTIMQLLRTNGIQMQNYIHVHNLLKRSVSKK